MHDGILQTDVVVWFGIAEPQWDDEDWEEDRLSLRIVKVRKKGSWSISRKSQKTRDFPARS